MAVDFADTVFLSFGCNQEDKFQPVFRGNILVFGQKIGHRQIGNNHTIHSYPAAFLAKFSKPNCITGFRYPIIINGI